MHMWIVLLSSTLSAICLSFQHLFFPLFFWLTLSSTFLTFLPLIYKQTEMVCFVFYSYFIWSYLFVGLIGQPPTLLIDINTIVRLLSMDEHKQRIQVRYKKKKKKKISHDQIEMVCFVFYSYFIWSYLFVGLFGQSPTLLIDINTIIRLLSMDGHKHRIQVRDKKKKKKKSAMTKLKWFEGLKK